MTEKEKLYRAYYQPDSPWTGSKAIKELQKITSNFEKRQQIMVNQTNTLASSYTSSKRNKSSTLQYERN